MLVGRGGGREGEEGYSRYTRVCMAYLQFAEQSIE